ncbi:hypothetical protein ADM96_26285 [Burkholderia sp. ST111]|nr:hypothetical protein ADM96_26285 [Burkholderia sp. ST111]
MLQFPASDASSSRSFARFGNLTLSSAFQPVFSFAHRRSIGYEALLRANDPTGNAIAPSAVFGRTHPKATWTNLERGVQWLHVSNFKRIAGACDWLFLNSSPDGFVVSEAYRRLVEESLRQFRLAPERIVLEVLETPNGDPQRLTEGIASFRELGFLIALDDFGAGHSNIDRVWQIQPDIVKLDRRVIEQAALNPRVARLLPRLVSLLHETGVLVLVEGVETREEALLALESEADFTQGFYFARPAAIGVDTTAARSIMDSLRQLSSTRNEEEMRNHAAFLSTYVPVLHAVAERLAAGADVAGACAIVLRRHDVTRCILLDALGEQIGGDVSLRPTRSMPSECIPAWADVSKACGKQGSWACFREAIGQPGTVQVSQPYLSATGSNLCTTLSLAFSVQGEARVLCADIDRNRIES